MRLSEKCARFLTVPRPMLLSVAIEETERGLARLTREQFQCLDMFEDNNRVLVVGSAGTGKTVLAIEQVRRAFARGEKVGYFCFNSALAFWARAQLQPIMTGGSYVGTLRAFVVSRSGQSASKVDSGYFEKELPRTLVDGNQLQDISYDRIIVDEAQDLITKEYLAVLDCVVKAGLDRGKWSFFGDFASQAIYQRGLSEDQLIALLDDYSTYAKAKLTINCRNTKSIGMQTMLVAGHESCFPEEAIEGESVTYDLWHAEGKEGQKLINLISSLSKQGFTTGIS